jgi:hypothetical protein
MNILKLFRKGGIKKNSADLTKEHKYSGERFIETQKLFEEFKDSAGSVFSTYGLDLEDYDPAAEFAYDEWQESKFIEINEAFRKEHDLYIKHNVYFYGCPIKIYKLNYYDRFYEHIERTGNDNELNFIEMELRRGILNFDYNFLNNDLQNSIEDSLKQRLNFLSHQLKQYNYQIKEDNSENGFAIVKSNYDKKLSQEVNDSEEDEVVTNYKERILYLNETGVLKYLKEFDPAITTSVNKLAELLSYIIGVKGETIQSYINPIFNKEGKVTQKNNPYSSKKNVSKVQKVLTEKIGINLKDEYTKHF